MATTPQDTPNLSPELVVVAHSDARLRLSGSRVRSSADGAAALEQALAETGARLRPLFGASEERIHATRRASAWDLPDLSVFYHAAVDGDHQAVAARLAEVPAVSGAFVKPPPAIDADLLAASADVASAAAAAAGTPDLTPHQGYLAAAPDGISASSVRSQPGGDGTGVQVINVGGAWRLTHEDLAGNVGGVVGGQPIDAVSFRNHGTAMLGVIRATLNVFGMTGIAPGCQVRQVATFGLGTAAAIRLAADSLPAGGVILIEWQRPGPGSTGVGAAGFLPLEWWPDDFAAIAYATAKGVIVIEPAWQRGGLAGRPPLQHARTRVPRDLAQPVQPGQRRLRLNPRRRGRAAARREQHRAGQVPAAVLQHRRLGRRAGLGGRHRYPGVRRPAGRRH